MTHTVVMLICVVAITFCFALLMFLSTYRG